MTCIILTDVLLASHLELSTEITELHTKIHALIITGILVIYQAPMTFWGHKEVHVLIHIIVGKTFLTRHLGASKATEEMRRCET